MATSNGFLHTDPAPPPSPLLPPWLSNSSAPSTIRPPSLSVTLSLSPSTVPAAPMPWLHQERAADNSLVLGTIQHGAIAGVDGLAVSELAECCRDLEEGHRAWVAHKKETAWRLRRVEMQLESEKACKKREKMEEIESKVRALREEQKMTLDRIEAEYKEQILGLRKDAEAKEQKLAEQWVAKHLRLAKFLEQMGCRQWPAEPSGR